MNQDIDIEIARSIMFEPGVPSPDVCERARARLVAAAAGDRRVFRERRRLPRVLSRRAPFGVVLVGAAAAAAIVVATSGQDSIVRPQVASAATILHKAAYAVTDSLAADPGPDQYQYTKTIVKTNVSDGSYSALVTQVDNMWESPQREGMQTRKTVKVGYSSPQARQDLNEGAGPATKGGGSLQVNGALQGKMLVGPGAAFDGDLTYAQMEAMPTDTTDLRAEIAKLADNGSQDSSSSEWIDHEMFDIIHGTLLEPLVPAKLRAALYQVAATIPGVTELGLTKDAAGRDALIVTFSDPLYNQRDELLFDPNTYVLTGASEVNAKTGEIEESEAIIQSQVVNTIPQAAQSMPARFTS